MASQLSGMQVAIRRIPRRPRARLLASVIFLLSAASCGTAPVDVSGTTEWHPTAIGAPVPGVVVFMKLHPGDRIELVRAEPVGQASNDEGGGPFGNPRAPAADILLTFSPPTEATGWCLGCTTQPLAGAAYAVPATPPENTGATTVGVVATITPNEAGEFDLTGVRLTYRLNGVERTDTAETEFHVCAAATAPADCGGEPTGG